MSTKTVRGVTWFLILGGLLVRSGLLLLAEGSLSLGAALYLVGPYLALAIAFYWLGQERRPAVAMLTGTVVTVLITVCSILAVFELPVVAYFVFLIPAAQLICVAITVAVALAIKVFSRPAVPRAAAAG